MVERDGWRKRNYRLKSVNAQLVSGVSISETAGLKLSARIFCSDA